MLILRRECVSESPFWQSNLIGGSLFMLRQLTGRCLSILPDRPFIYLFFYRKKHQFPDLKNPRRFTEKLQWLKLNGNLERFAQYADKYTVRSYVEKKIGADRLIPLLGVWDNFDDIPFDELPERFVLKATHGCDYNFICQDKAAIDLPVLRAKVNGWLNENYYRLEREPQYKNCKPRIVCEQYMEDSAGKLVDYKIFCSGGVPKIIQLDSDRFSVHRKDFMDTKWQRLTNIALATHPSSPQDPARPANLDELLEVATVLCQDFPFVRVDLYNLDGKIYFGELTFTPGSGVLPYAPLEADYDLGELVELAAY